MRCKNQFLWKLYLYNESILDENSTFTAKIKLRVTIIHKWFPREFQTTKILNERWCSRTQGMPIMENEGRAYLLLRNNLYLFLGLWPRTICLVRNILRLHRHYLSSFSILNWNNHTSTLVRCKFWLTALHNIILN